MEAILTFPPTAVYNIPYKTTEILPGRHYGERQYVDRFYNITIYDRNGVLQKVTNSYSVNYFV